MARWALLLVLASRIAAASPKISTTDTASAAELRAGTTEVITHDLATALASTACENCHVDASVARLEAAPTREGTLVTADLRFTVTDEAGVVLTVVATCSHAIAQKQKLATVRDEALHGAVASASSRVARALRTQIAGR